MIVAILAFLALLFATPVWAQGCGSQNPQCIVPTAPFGTSNNQAASTEFVQQNKGGASAGLIIGSTPVVSGTGGVMSDSGSVLVELTNAQLTAKCALFGAASGCAPSSTTSGTLFLRDDATW